MPKFQVWLRGTTLIDVTAKSADAARAFVRRFYKVKRLPKGTFVCEIPPNYYDYLLTPEQMELFRTS